MTRKFHRRCSSKFALLLETLGIPVFPSYEPCSQEDEDTLVMQRKPCKRKMPRNDAPAKLRRMKKRVAEDTHHV